MTQRYAHYRDEAMRSASDLAGDIIDQAISNGKIVSRKYFQFVETSFAAEKSSS
jgi:hypothetical protein